MTRFVQSLFAALALPLALAACAAAPAAPNAASAAAPQPAERRAPVTILVSIDGFHPDYLDRGATPNLDALAAQGVAAAMQPSFPSKTFPNHWALVTGEYPDRNGISANTMEDPARPGEVFTMASDDPFWWNAAAPVWVDAERQGVRSATMFWPGSNVAWGGTRDRAWPYTITGGVRPQDWQQFNQAIDDTQRVNAVLDWVRRPAAIRPRLVTLYFDIVDTAGHTYGPADARTIAAVADVDRSIGQLVAGLAALGQPANIVVVSDHGMAATSSERVVALDQVADPALYRVVESGPYATLEPSEGNDAKLAAALLAPHAHMQCWRKHEIPARFHYGSNPRIPPFLCLAETGWLIAPGAPTQAFAGGNHGYDNAAPEMAAIFIAAGPNIRRAAVAAGFSNVEVYPLVARLAGVTPHASDASGAIADALVAK
jgi:predicted AlkP superfamily pyrophosphatase or phosphodiesterase